MKKNCLILIVIAFLFSCASTAQSPGLSPEVGNDAPDFSLLDVSGNEVRLSDFRGKENVVLFFYLNGRWSACIQQLGGLQEKISEIKELDTEVIAFATQGNQYDVKSTKNVYRITYTLIPTPNRTVAEDFGAGNSAFGTIIIDKKGRIRYKDISSSSMQHSVSKIIRELQGI